MPVDRDGGGAKGLKMILDRLLKGGAIILFPEGTRTVREPVNPMTSAVGLVAARAGVPVQTVIIECDWPYLRKGWPLFRRPSLPIGPIDTAIKS